MVPKQRHDPDYRRTKSTQIVLKGSSSRRLQRTLCRGPPCLFKWRTAFTFKRLLLCVSYLLLRNVIQSSDFRAQQPGLGLDSTGPPWAVGLVTQRPALREAVQTPLSIWPFLGVALITRIYFKLQDGA